MADAKKLDDISHRLSESIERIDVLQSRKALPWTTRLRNHVGRNSSQLANVVLTGCIFAVAAGRLNQRREYEVCLVSIGHLQPMHVEPSRDSHSGDTGQPAQAVTAKMEAERSALSAENSRCYTFTGMGPMRFSVLQPARAMCAQIDAGCRLRRELDEASTSYRRLADGVAAELDKRAWWHSLATRIKGVLQATQPDSASVRSTVPSLHGSSQLLKAADKEKVLQEPPCFSRRKFNAHVNWNDSVCFHRVAAAPCPRVLPSDSSGAMKNLFNYLVQPVQLGLSSVLLIGTPYCNGASLTMAVPVTPRDNPLQQLNSISHTLP